MSKTGGLKKASAKVLVVAFAIILAVTQLTFIGAPLSFTKSLMLLTTSIVLVSEIGVKRLTNIGFDEQNDITLWIGLMFVLTLFAVSMFTLAGIAIPIFLKNVIDYIVLGSTLWIVVEAFA